MRLEFCKRETLGIHNPPSQKPVPMQRWPHGHRIIDTEYKYLFTIYLNAVK